MRGQARACKGKRGQARKRASCAYRSGFALLFTEKRPSGSSPLASLQPGAGAPGTGRQASKGSRGLPRLPSSPAGAS
eukprot:7147341-Alexandrium_andersonii.AAC.1